MRVTSGLVLAGLSIGIFLSWQMPPPARDRVDATSPMIALHLALLIRRWTTDVVVSVLDSVSSTTYLICFPSTPPLALACSTASFAPSLQLTPKSDWPPVSDA